MTTKVSQALLFIGKESERKLHPDSVWCEGGDLNPHEITFTWT